MAKQRARSRSEYMTVGELIDDLQKYKREWPVAIWWQGQGQWCSGRALETQKISQGKGVRPIVSINSDGEQ